MPRCGATFDESSVPPWKRGDFRGVLNAGRNPPRRCATAVAAVKASQAFTASDGGDFQRVERPLVSSFRPSEARAGIQSSGEASSGFPSRHLICRQSSGMMPLPLWRRCKVDPSLPPDLGVRPRGFVQKPLDLFASWIGLSFALARRRRKVRNDSNCRHTRRIHLSIHSWL